MPQDRRERVQRILKVQEQLRQVEEWRLAQAQQHVDGLAQEQTELIAALNADDGLQGLFMDATVRRLRSLAEQAKAAVEVKDQQAERLLEAGTKAGAAERLLATVSKEAERAEEASQLAETTERLTAQAPGRIQTVSGGRLADGLGQQEHAARGTPQAPDGLPGASVESSRRR